MHWSVNISRGPPSEAQTSTAHVSGRDLTTASKQDSAEGDKTRRCSRDYKPEMRGKQPSKSTSRYSKRSGLFWIEGVRVIIHVSRHMQASLGLLPSHTLCNRYTPNKHHHDCTISRGRGEDLIVSRLREPAEKGREDSRENCDYSQPLRCGLNDVQDHDRHHQREHGESSGDKS